MGEIRIASVLGTGLAGWRVLRDRAAHPAAYGQEVDRKAVAAMVLATRTLLDGMDQPPAALVGSDRPYDEFTSIRGKYVFVPTSVEHFLRRKREDMALEDCE